MDKNKDLQRKQEDAAFAHGLWYIGCAILVEFVLLFLKKAYFIGGTTYEAAVLLETIGDALPIAFVVFPLVFAVAAVKGFLCFRKTGTVCPVIEGALALSGALSLSTSMCLIYGLEGCHMMMLFVPAMGALAFCFFLYHHDFFYSAALSGATGMVLWMIWHQAPANAAVSYIGIAKILVFSALLIWVCNLLKKSGGELTMLGHAVRFMPVDATYPAIYATIGVSAIATLVAAVLGGVVAMYCIYAMGAWIFALLVFYTVKML